MRPIWTRSSAARWRGLRNRLIEGNQTWRARPCAERRRRCSAKRKIGATDTSWGSRLFSIEYATLRSRLTTVTAAAEAIIEHGNARCMAKNDEGRAVPRFRGGSAVRIWRAKGSNVHLVAAIALRREQLALGAADDERGHDAEQSRAMRFGARRAGGGTALSLRRRSRPTARRSESSPASGFRSTGRGRRTILVRRSRALGSARERDGAARGGGRRLSRGA